MPLLAGVDEAGRGPLAGPVVAAAVILDGSRPIEGLKDSKLLSPTRRESLRDAVLANALAVGVGIVHEPDIDKLNILEATRSAMRQAVGRLRPQPQEMWVDGPPLPNPMIPCRGIVGGDRKVPVISAASIVAKVTRDRIMENYDRIFPEYGFAKHKGYGTPAHLQAIRTQLACPIHRLSFHPIRQHLPSLKALRQQGLLGRWGERLAARSLVHKGWTVLHLNVNAAPYGELDIVAQEGGTIVFVEVKSTASQVPMEAAQRADEKKVERLGRAAEVFLDREGDRLGECEGYRFDLVTVTFGEGRPAVAHFTDWLG